MATGRRRTSKAAGAPEAKDGSYAVLTPVNHDGVDYGIGDTIELTGEHAAPLLAVKAIEEAEAA